MRGIKLALLARINKIRSKSWGAATKTKNTYNNLNVPEKVSAAKSISVSSWQSFYKNFCTILRKPVRQVSHFSLISLIIVVLLSGVQAPETADVENTIPVDPFEMIASTQKAENENLDLLELEIVGITASFINTDMANEVYKKLDSVDSESKFIVTGGPTLANNYVPTTESSSGADTIFTKYVIQGGDTLSGIAQKFGITTNSIKWSNSNISNIDFLKPGAEINIPSVTGVIYTVKAGDTIDMIASKYKSNASLIIAKNDLYGEDLVKGMTIIIPDGKVDEPKPTSSSSSRYGSSSAISRTGSFKFPTLVGRSGYYNGYHWWAIDIPNNIGTPIYASDSGRITIASYGWNGGYGNTILIDHGAGFSTRYAHLSTILIRGGYVSKGQIIGYMGSTGRSTGPHLHFEILKNGARQNPLWYL